MPLSPSTIVTCRLTLTPLEVDDAEAMVAVLDDERMHEFTGGRPLTITELRARFQRLAVGRSADGKELWFNWIVRRNVDGRPVGAMQATVTVDGSSADVAWEVGKRWQGEGIASEAAGGVVEWLVDNEVGAIRALIHPDHHASAGVATRAGLRPTSDVVDGEIVWLRTSRGADVRAEK